MAEEKLDISVLYVEDDPATLSGLISFLERRVNAVFPATNGREGLDLFARQRPDIVVTDIKMPVMDGIEMAANIKDLDRDCPVIVTTAHGDADILIRAIELGIDWYVMKPINIEKLMDSIEKISLRKKKEKMLKLYQQRLDMVISNAPIVLFALDSDGTFILSEGRGLEALGLRPGEIVGSSVFDIYRDVPEIITAIDRALKGGSFIERAKVAGLVYETRYSPIRDENGEISGVIAVAVDVTEQKRMEKEIKILRGILPICSSCKKIRDDAGYWSQIELYIREHSDAEFTHSICPQCVKKLYPGCSNKPGSEKT